MKKKRNKTNGFLSVDSVTGEEFVILYEDSKSENIASYFLLLCFQTLSLGYSHLIVFLDNNSTHKEKMIKMLNKLLSIFEIADKITVEFIYTPSYSPNRLVANPVEALFNIEFNHSFIDTVASLVQMEEENSLGILSTPSRSESIISPVEGCFVSGFEGVFGEALPGSIRKGWHSKDSFCPVLFGDWNFS